MVSHQPAESGGERHGDSEYIKYLGYYVISQDHMIKGSYDFMSRNPLK